jgi:hypothetical protein
MVVSVFIRVVWDFIVGMYFIVVRGAMAFVAAQLSPECRA